MRALDTARAAHRTAAAWVVACAALALWPRALAGQQARSHGGRCAAFGRADADGRYLAPEDLHPPVPAVDGTSLLALVDRSPRFGLGPGWTPGDLVDVRTGAALGALACVPPDHQCLRREAARAFAALEAALTHDAGERAWIDSAFRAHDVQCAVFGNWAYRDHHGFCDATTFSALPGHSQHQLGTAIDVFTASWVRGGARFRDGFGCSTGGRWLAAHAWEHGFVLPYPLNPDDRLAGSDCAARPGGSTRVDPRTGYKHEPWHLRYIGVENASRFHAAWLASGPASGDEITLEQWLRRERREPDAVEPAACDGCACGGCATFRASSAPGPCGDGATAEHLGADGLPRVASAPPSIEHVTLERRDGVVRIVARVQVPADTLTQTPVARGVTFGADTTASHRVRVAGGVAHAYPALARTWVLGAGPEAAGSLAWRAALVEPTRDDAIDATNARLPAASGAIDVELRVAGVAPGARLRVALTGREGERDARVVPAP